ncbi:hypothetical protein DPMN_118032 [Dreissena polymorpha]|uniref:Uncharacterized protein n=1 Tax=Dreissena polymorpha TaxID=45954 RepID=A0A9D4JLA7_DREPO|nr:hypothetical protein DPMN_118032 [Dreissena polymorpha]
MLSTSLREWSGVYSVGDVSIVVCQRGFNINILTKFHQDWMQTVTSTVYTNKLLTDGRTDTRRHAQRTPDITRSHKLTVSLHDSCSSSHCVNTFFVTVNGGGGGGGGVVVVVKKMFTNCLRTDGRTDAGR